MFTLLTFEKEFVEQNLWGFTADIHPDIGTITSNVIVLSLPILSDI